MKTFIQSILIGVGIFAGMVALVLGLFQYSNTNANNHKAYEVAAVVDEVNLETDCITLIDSNGEAWVYESEGFEVGQMVVIEFDDLGTNNIYDDEIIEIRA